MINESFNNYKARLIPFFNLLKLRHIKINSIQKIACFWGIVPHVGNLYTWHKIRYKIYNGFDVMQHHRTDDKSKGLIYNFKKAGKELYACLYLTTHH